MHQKKGKQMSEGGFRKSSVKSEKSREPDKPSVVALDLFCGAGGSAVGLSRAGFEVIGYDKSVQPEYPYEFIQSDITKMKDTHFEFDFVWASPPCQAYSVGTKGFRNAGRKYPDLVSWTRDLLISWGKPFVIENVPGAPIRRDLSLIGPMFGLRVIRRRNFEIHGFNVRKLPVPKYEGSVREGDYASVVTGCVNPGCFGKREQFKPKYGHLWKRNNKIEKWQAAMGITHITDRTALAQAIPPAYSEYIAREFLWQK